MYRLRLALLLLIPGFLLFSCKKELHLNADWKDITIVYGILNQLDSVHYIKVTKAFLGPGNAMEYARIADSSNYLTKLQVTLEAWNGTNLTATHTFDTTTINDKDSGTFYYPFQLMYSSTSPLDPDLTYKLIITEPVSQKQVTSGTRLIRNFSVEKPIPYQSLSFDPGKNSEVKWTSAAGGKRYQVIVRFHYMETHISNPSQSEEKYLDWIIIPGKLSKNDEGGEELRASYANDGFYALLHTRLVADPDIERAARYLRYTFTVAADDLNSYIEVSQPSNSIIQDKPTYSNIENGIGLFSARFVQTLDSLQLAPRTITELQTNPLTKDLGF